MNNVVQAGTLKRPDVFLLFPYLVRLTARRPVDAVCRWRCFTTYALCAGSVCCGDVLVLVLFDREKFTHNINVF